MFALTKVTVDGLRRFQLYASGKTEVRTGAESILWGILKWFLKAFMQLYSEILDSGGPAFGTILRHVRDRPQDSFVFHCTGKSAISRVDNSSHSVYSWERPYRGRRRNIAPRRRSTPSLDRI